MKGQIYIRLVVFVAMLVALVILKPNYLAFVKEYPLNGKFEFQLYYIALAAIIFSLGRVAVLIVYQWRKPHRKGDNVVNGIHLIAQLIYGSMIILLILAALNVNVIDAFTSLSLIAAAIAIITKDYISNIINGMIIAFSHLIEIDDHISIGDVKGRVQEITLTNIRMLTDDDDVVFVPNNLVLNKELINYTRQEVKRSSLEFEVAPSQVSDIDVLESKIMEAMKHFKAEIKQESFTLKVVHLGKDALKFKVQYVLVDPRNKELERKVRRYCVRQIVRIIHSN